MRAVPLVLPLMLYALAGCGAGDAPSGGLTPDQNKTLDDAAQKLDAQRAVLPKRDTAEAPAKSETPPASAPPKSQPAQ